MNSRQSNLLTDPCEPVCRNLPFFIIFTALLTPHVLSGFLNDVRNHFSEIAFADSFSFLAFNLAEVLAFAYLVCLAVHVLKCRYLKHFMFVFALLLFGVNMYLRICFGTLLSSGTLLLIGETNRREATEFFETFLFSSTGIAIAVGLVAALAIYYLIDSWYEKKAGIILGKRTGVLLAMTMAVVLCLAAVETSVYINNFKNQSFASYERLLTFTQKYPRMDYCRRLINSMYLLHLSGEETKQAISIAKIAGDEVDCTTPNDSLTIVLVVGESFIKSHASVYGYALPTMPFLDNENANGNLVAFNNVVTTAKHTSMALRNFFSCNSVGDGERWSESTFFPTLFKASGYDVYFWDNQYEPFSQNDLDFALNAYIHNAAINDLSYTACNDSVYEYDGDLVESFKNTCLSDHNARSNNALVIFHLMGQHFSADKRYPHTPEFYRFNSDSISRKADYLTASKKEEIAEYDNAVLYNDYVLRDIVGLFKEHNSILLFLSDHGELVYDVSDVKGRTKEIDVMSVGEMAHYYSIPMVLWMSEKYKNKHPEMVELIAKCKDRRLMSDNICQLLLHIGNIRTKWYQSCRDVLSLDYQCPPRIIESSVDYDKVQEHND